MGSHDFRAYCPTAEVPQIMPLMPPLAMHGVRGAGRGFRGERGGLIPPDRDPATGSANSRTVWPANHRSAAVVSVWPANNRSPVGSGASGSIHPLGANNGMGRLGQSES